MDLDRLTSWPRHASKLATAAFRPRCSVAGMRVDIPGGRVIRWSVIAGKIRLHRIIDEIVNAGDTVVDGNDVAPQDWLCIKGTLKK